MSHADAICFIISSLEHHPYKRWIIQPTPIVRLGSNLLSGKMKQPQICLLVTLLFFGNGAILDGRRSPRSTPKAAKMNDHVLVDVYQRSGGQSAKPIVKPLLSGVGGISDVKRKGDSPQRQVHVASTMGRTRGQSPIFSRSGGLHSRSRLGTCSPRTYRVKLQSGNCSGTVTTKVHVVS